MGPRTSVSCGTPVFRSRARVLERLQLRLPARQRAPLARTAYGRAVYQRRPGHASDRVSSCWRRGAWCYGRSGGRRVAARPGAMIGLSLDAGRWAMRGPSWVRPAVTGAAVSAVLAIYTINGISLLSNLRQKALHRRGRRPQSAEGRRAQKAAERRRPQSAEVCPLSRHALPDPRSARPAHCCTLLQYAPRTPPRPFENILLAVRTIDPDRGPLACCATGQTAARGVSQSCR